MKKKFFAIVALLSIILSLAMLFSGCSKNEYSKSAVKGSKDGVFDYKSLEDAKKDWNLHYKEEDSEKDVFSFTSKGLTFNTSESYAYASQPLKLRPRAYYKVTYNFDVVRAEGNLGYSGLFVGFEEDPNFNVTGDKRTNHNRSGDKKLSTESPETFYFKTDSGREFNLKVAFGTKDRPVSGTATISNLRIVRVKESVAKAEEATGHQLYEIKATVFGRASSDNIAYIILGSILVMVLGYALYSMRSRDIGIASPVGGNKARGLHTKIASSRFMAPVLVISISFAIRLLILAIQSSIASGKSIAETLFGFNLENLAYQGQWIAEHGTPYFYKHNAASNFMPLMLYLSSFAGVFGNLAKGGVSGELVTVSLIKFFAIIADIATALIIYKMVEIRQGRTAGLIMSMAFALMPVSFLASAAGWSVSLSICSLFIVLAFKFLLSRNYWGMSGTYFIACMISPAALLFSPIFLIYTFVYMGLAIKERKPKEYMPPIFVIVGYLVLFFLIMLPFSIKHLAEKPMFAFNKFIEIISGKGVYTLNAFNFQGLLKNNFASITTQSTLVTILFVIFLVVVIGILYIKSRNRLQLALLASGLGFMSWTFLNNMTPEAIIVVLPVLLLATLHYEDKRLYLVYLLYSMTAFINISYLHLIVGYGPSGINHISYEKTAIMYVMGVINLLILILDIIVIYDIVISKKQLPFASMEVKYTDYLKMQFRSARKAFASFGMKMKAAKAAISQERAEKKEEKRRRKLDASETDEDSQE